ncbi:hypothetical protein D3C81_951700 [compost metagenome]
MDLIGVEDIRKPRWRIKIGVEVVRYFAFLIKLSPFGTDQDDPIGRFGTIDRSRRGVFDKRHVHDVIRIELIQGTGRTFYAVDDDQRIAIDGFKDLCICIIVHGGTASQVKSGRTVW